MPSSISDLERIFVRFNGRTIDLKKISSRSFRKWIENRFPAGLLDLFFTKRTPAEYDAYIRGVERWSSQKRVDLLNFIEHEHGWTPTKAPKKYV